MISDGRARYRPVRGVDVGRWTDDLERPIRRVALEFEEPPAWYALDRMLTRQEMTALRRYRHLFEPRLVAEVRVDGNPVTLYAFGVIESDCEEVFVIDDHQGWFWTFAGHESKWRRMTDDEALEEHRDLFDLADLRSIVAAL